VEELMKLDAHFVISERSQASEARRIAAQFAVQLGFDEERTGKVAIVATEAANNLVKHSQGGEIVLHASGSQLEVVCLDRGPGMNVEACLEDGYSTTGTSGTGLGAMKRLSDGFDAYSTPQGTVILATFGQRESRYGAVRVPKTGERVCGDAWSFLERDGSTWIIMADGLGHGEFAANASEQAVKIFEKSRMDTVTAIMEEVHAGLRATRGAAVAIIQVQGRTVTYCGLGNIAGVIYSGTANVHMVSHSGTAGVEARKIAPFTYTWTPGAILILHSDGLQSQWGFERYPGLTRHDPAILSAVLYRDYNRGRDDTTVMAVRQ
jgi:anti-sigma regulatory factor (Ser/Thr protein kinase)